MTSLPIRSFLFYRLCTILPEAPVAPPEIVNPTPFHSTDTERTYACACPHANSWNLDDPSSPFS